MPTESSVTGGLPNQDLQLTYRYRAYEPGIKEQAVAMAINGGGIRDTARVLKIDKNTVIRTLKKGRQPCASESREV